MIDWILNIHIYPQQLLHMRKFHMRENNDNLLYNMFQISLTLSWSKKQCIYFLF